MIVEFLNTYGMNLLYSIVVAIGGFIGLALKNLATKFINDKIKERVAMTAVKGVEQIYKELHGDDKLNAAFTAASEMLAEKGIAVSELELRMLLEAAVAECNDAFNKKKPVTQDGIAVEDMTDDQLRSVLQQMGFAYTDHMTRDEMLTTLEEEAE